MIRKILLIASVCSTILCTGCTGYVSKVKEYVTLSNPLSGERPKDVIPEEWSFQTLANRVLPGGLKLDFMDEEYCILSKANEGDILIYKHTDAFQKEIDDASKMYPYEDMGESSISGYKMIKVNFSDKFVDYYIYREGGYIFRLELNNDSCLEKYMLYIKELIQ